MAVMNIPTVKLDGRDAAPADFAEALGNSWQEYGFVGIQGHGIEDALITEAARVVREFFALSEETKRRYLVPGGAGQRGFTPFQIEKAKDQVIPDLKEFWHVGRELPADHALAAAYPPNLWPEEVEGFRSTLVSLYTRLEELGILLLRGVALHLGLSEDWFDDKVDHGNSILRPLHYPPLPQSVTGVRAAQHEDINLLTLLVGSQEPGLEILARDGTWIPVTSIEGTIICNVGDMLQRLTNHYFPSTTHRVVNPPSPWCDRSRYSMPFFMHPNSEFLIETLPGCVNADRPDRYPEPITAHDYLHERLRELGLLVD